MNSCWNINVALTEATPLFLYLISGCADADTQLLLLESFIRMHQSQCQTFHLTKPVVIIESAVFVLMKFMY